MEKKLIGMTLSREKEGKKRFENLPIELTGCVKRLISDISLPLS